MIRLVKNAEYQWECDMCDLTVAEHDNKAPEGWHCVAIYNGYEGYSSKRFNLCPKCSLLSVMSLQKSLQEHWVICVTQNGEQIYVSGFDAFAPRYTHEISEALKYDSRPNANLDRERLYGGYVKKVSDILSKGENT